MRSLGATTLLSRAALVVGLALLVGSALAPVLFSAREPLTEEERRRLTDLDVEILDLNQQIERIKARTGTKMTAQEGSIAYRNKLAEREAIEDIATQRAERPASVSLQLRTAGVAVLLVVVVVYCFEIYSKRDSSCSS